MNGCGELVAGRRTRRGELVEKQQVCLQESAVSPTASRQAKVRLLCELNHEARLPGPQTKLTVVFISLSCR